MKKLIIVASALFAMSAFAADPAANTGTTGTAPDAGAMSHDAGTSTGSSEGAMTKEKTTTHTTKMKKGSMDHKGKMKSKKAAPSDASAPADAPAAQ